MAGEDTHLITTSSIDNVDGDLEALRLKLQNHTLENVTYVHGGFKNVVLQTVFNTTGIRYARRTIDVVVAGITYKIPADISITGPPLNPRITQQPANAISHANPGDPQPPVVFTIKATGLAPLVFKWQLWDINLSTFVNVSVGTTKPGFHATTVTVATIVNTSGQSSLTLNSTSPSSGNYDPAMFIRCSVDNLSVDGGQVFSSQAKLRVEDETCSCCFVFLACLNGKVPEFIQIAAKRDYYTEKRKRGYRLMCRWLIPKMEKHQTLMNFVNWVIVKPFLYYGGWLYERRNLLGWLLAPYCHAWLTAWNGIGHFINHPIAAPDKEIKLPPQLQSLIDDS
jgi:hypothetical protein